MLPRPEICHRCHGTPGLVRTIQANGVYRVYWRCKDCKEGIPTNPKSRMVEALPHKDVKEFLSQWGFSLDDIPIAEDYRHDLIKCWVCGSTNVEQHHIFPVKLIEQAQLAGDIDEEESWKWHNKIVPLCRKHHHLWHKWVTPNLIPGLAPEKDTT